MSKDIISTDEQAIEPSAAPLAQDALQTAFRASGLGNAWLIPEQGNKNHISRLSLYVAWLEATGKHWTNPSLVAYADYLLNGERLSYEDDKPLENLSPSSIHSHLSTIRARYRDLIKNPDFKNRVRSLADSAYPNYSASDRRVQVLTLLEDIEDALNPELTKHIKVTKKQDRIDSEHIRLSQSQAEALLDAPGIDTLRGLRDTALIYLTLSTGLREAEIVALNIEDIRQKSGDELGVYVRHGKGAKERFVPYGEMTDCLIYLDAWMAQANISQGAIFRGFTDRYTPNYAPFEKSPAIVYPRLTERLTTRAVQDILKAYPVMVDGSLATVKPHDLRRTYARLLWDSGMDLLAIRDNLGHADAKTTQTYIGDMNMSKRRAPTLLRAKHDKKLLNKFGYVEKPL